VIEQAHAHYVVEKKLFSEEDFSIVDKAISFVKSIEKGIVIDLDEAYRVYKGVMRFQERGISVLYGLLHDKEREELKAVATKIDLFLDSRASRGHLTDETVRLLRDYRKSIADVLKTPVDDALGSIRVHDLYSRMPSLGQCLEAYSIEEKI
jgi:hypothetical protein